MNPDPETPTPVVRETDWKQERYERMLSNLQHAYLIIHCGSDHMTDAKLMEMVQNTLCEVMGDREFCVWMLQNAPNRDEIA